MPKLDDVLGGYGANAFTTTINAQLVGQWRGVPITALQITTRDTHIAGYVYKTNTVLLVPRSVPGPDVVLTRQGLSWTNFLERDREVGHPPFDALFHVHAKGDQEARTVITPPLAELLATDSRTQGRVFFFGPQHLAAVFPGVITQPPVVAATADLLVEIGQLMSYR
ncbi:hypothetical protein ABZ814_07120 [Micromonospora musae]|uniref:hypothetical protein n=1 Tax=Micromonospora musae TaxID=1894970 RepID=UPI0033FC4448